jgi:hypothetical protein
MKKISFWEKTALSLVLFTSIAPIGFSFLFPALTTNLTHIKPTEIDKVSCENLLPSIKCKGALLIEANKLPKNNYTIFGISNTTPEVYCITEKNYEKISPTQWIWNFPIFKNNDIQCKGDIISVLIEKQNSPANAWFVSRIFIGSQEKLSTLLRTIQFYHIDIRPLLAVLAIFQLGLSFLIFKVIGNSLNPPTFSYSFLIVALMSLINGGLIERAIGLDFNQAFPLIKHFLTTLWVLTFIYETKYKNINNKKVAILSVATLILTMLSSEIGLSNSTVFSIIYFGWIVALVASKFRFLHLCIFSLNSFYMLALHTPYFIVPQFAGSLFLMLYMLGYQIEYVRLLLVSWKISQIANKITNSKQYRAYIKLIARSLNVNKITLAITKQDTFEYWIYTKNKQRGTIVSPETQSSVISKVYATGNALLDIHSDSSLGNKIANSGSYMTKRFTALPLSANGELSGILCLTDYEQNIRHKDLRVPLINAFKNAGNNLSVAIANSNNNKLREIEDFIRNTITPNNKLTLEEEIASSLTKIYDKFSISSYFASVESSNSIKPIISTGTLSELTLNFDDFKFSVNTSNEFGPISLAFKEERPVILQNWRPLADKLSESAKKLYSKFDTNSIMTIPVTRIIGKTEVRYLVWLQTNSKLVFTQQFHSLAKLIQSRFEQVVDAQVSKLVNQTVLSLADSSSIHAIVQGEATKICEFGELLMIDLGKSTTLSKNLGSDAYTIFIEQYTQFATSSLLSIGFKLQMVIGDALLLTKSISEPTDHNRMLSALFDCEEKVKRYANQIIQNTYNDIEPSIRACLVSGDISRDLVMGKGGGWAIVGSTISEVHKLESAAKKYRTGFYFELDNYTANINLNFIKTETQPWPGSGNLRFVEFSEVKIKKIA